MNDVIKWLESPEGERWSRGKHHGTWSSGIYKLASLKDDNPDARYPELFIWSISFPQGVIFVA